MKIWIFSLENHRPDNLEPSSLQGVDNLGLNYCALPAIYPITPTPGWTFTLFRLPGDICVGNSRCKLISLPHLPRGIIVCTLEKHIQNFLSSQSLHLHLVCSEVEIMGLFNR